MNEETVLNMQWHAAEVAERVELQRLRPFMLLRPKVFPDESKWCALYGDNLQDGVAGYGDTPDKAALDFDVHWLNEKVWEPTQREGEK